MTFVTEQNAYEVLAALCRNRGWRLSLAIENRATLRIDDKPSELTTLGCRVEGTWFTWPVRGNRCRAAYALLATLDKRGLIR